MRNNQIARSAPPASVIRLLSVLVLVTSIGLVSAGSYFDPGGPAPNAAVLASKPTPLATATPPFQRTPSGPTGRIISVLPLTTTVIAGHSLAFKVELQNTGSQPWNSVAQAQIEIRDNNGALRGTAVAEVGYPLQAGAAASVTADWPVPMNASGQYRYFANLVLESKVLTTTPASQLNVRPAAQLNLAQTLPHIPTSSSGSRRVALVPNEFGAFSGTGPLWTNIPEIPGIAFTDLPVASVNAGFLASFDTVVFMQVCDIATALDSSQKTDLTNWLGNGGKLMILDSDACGGSLTPDYSWFVYPFTTNNPGQLGATGGSLQILEENSLASADASSPYYVDTNEIVFNTDAVGDSNVMVTRDPHWFVDVQSTNANQVTGYVHAYAEYGHGLVIYNGLDLDYIGDAWLRKLYVLELQQVWNPSGLPHHEPVVGQSSIQVSPSAAPADGTTLVNVTVTIRDANGNRLPGQSVRVSSSRGPLDAFTNAVGVTDSNGHFLTTLRSNAGGVAQLAAEAFNSRQFIGSSTNVIFTDPGGGPIRPPNGSGKAPQIVDVQAESELDGLYALGIGSLNNMVHVTVDWRNNAPGSVTFVLNGQPVTQNAFGPQINQLVDFSTLHVGKNLLSLIATNAAGSDRRDFEMSGWQAPDWVIASLNAASQPALFRTYVEIEIHVPSEDFGSQFQFLFPGQTTSIDSFVIVKVKLPLRGGEWEADLGAGKNESTSPNSFKPTLKFLGQSVDKLKGTLTLGGQVDSQGMHVSQAGVKFEAEFAPIPLFQESVLIVLNAFPPGGPVAYEALNAIPPVRDLALKIGKFEIALEPSLSGDLALDFSNKTALTGAVTIGGDLKAKLSVLNDTAQAYAGVGLEGQFVATTASPNLRMKVSGKGFVGYEVHLLLYDTSVEYGVDLGCWSSYTPDCPTGPTHAARLTPANNTHWHVAGGGYDQPYAQFRGIRTSRVSGPANPAPAAMQANETLLVSNVFTFAQPSLAVAPDGQALLAWTHDDTSKPLGQNFEIYSSFWNGSSWLSPTAVTSNTYQDGNPQIAWTDNEHALAVWERIDDPALPPTSTLDVTTARKVEIVASTWSSTAQTWNAPVYLTQNNVLDRGPVVAASMNGQALAAWIQNTNGDLGGTGTSPDSVMASLWDGSQWLTPMTITTNLIEPGPLSVAFNGTQALVAYTQPITVTPGVTATSQVFTSEWDGLAWGAPVQRTASETSNINPRAFYSASGEPAAAWLADHQLTWQSLLSTEAYTTSVDIPASEFGLAKSPTGDLAVVWPQNNNIALAVFDQQSHLWSAPLTVTEDLSRENSLSPAFDPLGNLLIGYNKSAINSQEITATTNLGQVVTFTVPIQGQTDLYVLSRSLSKDLSVSADDLSVSNAHPSPGDTVVLSATIHNSGDMAASNFEVAFYDGDPATGGILIGAPTWTDPLAAGFTATVTTTFSIPSLGGQQQLFVVADPTNVIGESDETNNIASVAAFGPDLAIDNFFAESWGGSDVGLVTHVRNLGTAANPGATLAFYQGTLTGTLLTADSVPALAAGQDVTLTTPWNFGVLSEGSYPIVASVNRNQKDFSETFIDNNVAQSKLEVWPDLAVSPLYFWSDRMPNGDVIMTGTVFNFGTITATQATIAFYANDPLTTTNTVLTTSIGILPPASSVEVTGTWSAAPAAGYSLFLWADPDAAITETTKANNLASQQADFDLDLRPLPDLLIRGATATYTASLSSLNGFAAPVGLTVTGMPAGMNFSLGTQAVTPTTSLGLSITTDLNTLDGQYPLIIQASGAGVTHTLAITVSVVTPDFAPFAAPASQTVVQANAVSFTVALARNYGFSAPITLTASGIPAGAAFELAPNPVIPGADAVLTVTTSDNTPVGTYPLTILASSGALSHSTLVTITVDASVRDLSIAKWLDSGQPVSGGQIQYGIFFANQGNAAASGVVVTDNLPFNMSLISWYGYIFNPGYASLAITPTILGNNIAWNIGSLLPGSYGYIYPQVLISGQVLSGTSLINRAQISTLYSETDYSNNVVSLSLTATSPGGTSGGPDAIGYTFRDNRAPGGPIFNWIDATSGVNSGVTGDDNFGGPFPIGFSFPFYGHAYTDAFFSTNGFLTFGGGNYSYSNTTLPNLNAPHNLLAVFWDDLQVYTPQTIYYQQGGTAPSRYFLVEWFNVLRLGDTTHPLTFEALLQENGTVRFQYLNLNGTLDSTTVGIQDSSGTVGLQYDFDQTLLANGRAVEFIAPFGPTPTPTPTPTATPTPTPATNPLETNRLYLPIVRR